MKRVFLSVVLLAASVATFAKKIMKISNPYSTIILVKTDKY